MGCGMPCPLAMGLNEVPLPMGGVGGMPLVVTRDGGVASVTSSVRLWLTKLAMLDSMAGACITSVPSGLDRLDLVGGVCRGRSSTTSRIGAA